MTDKEKMVQLFTEIGLEFEILENEKAKGRNYPHAIGIEEGIGYGNFFCEFFFDENGKFVTHGVWE